MRSISNNATVTRMKPSNLGIVFGPTLLRSETDTLVGTAVFVIFTNRI